MKESPFGPYVKGLILLGVEHSFLNNEGSFHEDCVGLGGAGMRKCFKSKSTREGLRLNVPRIV